MEVEPSFEGEVREYEVGVEDEEDEEEGKPDCLERTGTESELDLIFAVLTIFSHMSSGGASDRLLRSWRLDGFRCIW